MTTTPENDSIVPDGWELTAGGRACLWLDGKPHRLKAPKLGELREITEMVRDTNDAHASLTRDAFEKITSLPEDDPERSALNRRVQRELNDTFEAAWWDVLSHITATLGAGFPGKDDLPGWVIADALNEVTCLVKHFQTAPPPRGGRP